MKKVHFTKEFPADLEFRQKILFEAGLNPKQHERIRAIAGPEEIRAIVRAFRFGPVFYQPGVRPAGHETEADSHGMEYVQNFNFRANLHIHTRYSDGELSVPEMLNQAAAYADRVAPSLTRHSAAPYAPFTVGIMDHNRVGGCIEAIHRIYEQPERYRNLRVVLGAEVTVRLYNIGAFALRRKRHVHFLMLGITPQDPILARFFEPFENGISPENPSFHGSPSVTLPTLARTVRSMPYGFLAMAHPSRVLLKKFLAEEGHEAEAMRAYISFFRRAAGARALYVEAFYQAYSGALAANVEEYHTILNAITAERLYAAGGMDTHGGSIFYSVKK